MDYKYNLGQVIQVNSIIRAKGKIEDRLSKPGVNLYQIEVLEHEKYQGNNYWFAEHELEKITYEAPEEKIINPGFEGEEIYE